MRPACYYSIFLIALFLSKPLAFRERDTGLNVIILQGKVIRIQDGDTFQLFHEKPFTVRLAHIDCPEKGQPFGAKAKQFASRLCFGKTVLVYTDGTTDRNKRIVGEIILPDGTNVNKEMVKNGLAWHFKKYSKNKEYAALEEAARKAKLGLWADPNPIPPWLWRKLR
ncbi:MAG: thermonuclease family protein [Chitinophagaceae bacterium]|nr:thermonuclease family protein [Chitinophagaceae bacterium]